MSAVLEPPQKVQPIAGVSAGVEAEIMTVYPSIAATGIGRRIGRVSDAVPLRSNGVPWPRLLIAMPLWLIVVPVLLPIALTVYIFTKLFGQRYVLTNRSIQLRPMIGIRLIAEASLTDIQDIVIEELPGQAFFKAGDLVATAAGNKTLIRLEAVPNAAVLRETILEARDARLQVAESLKTIQARVRQ